MDYEYVATGGGKFRIKPFTGYVDLRKDHKEILEGKVSYIDTNTLKIETSLKYEIGQSVSIGGFVSNVVNFKLLELSITDYPVFKEAQIISKKEVNYDD